MKNIRDTIREYLNQDIAPFSMPGHKYGRAFKDFDEVLLRGDLTEVEGLDNLHHPEGIIKNALDDLSTLYGSERSYFLVNGSTSGNLCMIFSAFKEGDKVLIERGCHTSIFNGIILRKLRTSYLDYNYNYNLGLPISNDSDDIIKRIDDEKDIKGVILTYPNYYGICFDLKAVSEKCKQRGILLIVDSAHGAHFGFSSALPENAVKLGADMVVESAHKTLPSLTQTAFLHVNNKNLIDKCDFYTKVFSSTSPSYMFMMSLEYSKDFLREQAYQKYSLLVNRIDRLKDEIKDIPFLRIINKDYIGVTSPFKIYDYDNSRVVINIDKGLSGHKLLNFLKINNVQCEMSDERNVVLIPTPFNIEEDYVKLVKALNRCTENDIKEESKKVVISKSYEKVIEPYEAEALDKICISLEDSEGMVSGDNIVPYPPGVPLIVIGERITRNHIDVINGLIKDGIDVLGVNDNIVKIVNHRNMEEK